MSLRRLACLAAPVTLMAACGQSDDSLTASQSRVDVPAAEPEEISGMVAAANPDAVEAGLEALRSGGDAIDAAIAVQAVLGLVEPQSSGIGGGAFMLRYDAATGEITVYDGRETAPAGIDENLFLNEAGQPLGFVEAWRSGRSTGVPGVIAMLAMAHDEHGELPWAQSLQPAIALAEDGFEVAPRLNAIAGRMAQFTDIEETGAAAEYLFDENAQPLPVGHVLTNPEYAATLRAVGEDPRNFYTGEIARAIVDTARQPPLPGALTLDDLARYEPTRRQALCSTYRGYSACSAPPPSSGGVAIGMILGLLERFNMSEHRPDTVEGWRLFIEASRLAYADRDRYVGDPAYADVPVAGMLDRVYLSERAGLIDPEQAMASVEAGTPPGATPQAEDTTNDAPGTSHFVVMDGDGDVVSMTTSVESPFGSGRMAGGFFLNNQLTDFAFVARNENGDLLPNAAAPGKRPRSSMSPTILLDSEGDFVFATGSPGGNSIIAYTAKTIVAMMDWELSPQAAADLPNVVARGDVVRIEDGFDPELIEGLRERGFTIEAGRGENSGIHIVRVTEDGSLVGAADPRRDGIVGTP